jgi:hypothetical protein
MASKPKPVPEELPHSKPGSVDQQMEDSFPASDPPSFSRVIAGAPAPRKRKPEVTKKNRPT